MLFSNIGVQCISYLHSHSQDVNKETLSAHLSSSDNSSVQFTVGLRTSFFFLLHHLFVNP